MLRKITRATTNLLATIVARRIVGFLFFSGLMTSVFQVGNQLWSSGVSAARNNIQHQQVEKVTVFTFWDKAFLWLDDNGKALAGKISGVAPSSIHVGNVWQNAKEGAVHNTNVPNSGQPDPEGAVLSSTFTAEENREYLDIFTGNDERKIGRETLYPDYYQKGGNSGINVADFPEPGQVFYSNLDELGRTQTVRASLTYDLISSRKEREDIPTSAAPSGWGYQEVVTIKWYDPQKQEEREYNGHFWNKSHLLADSLGGRAVKVNLITGTRTQNVGGTNQKGGMRYSEIKAKKFLEENPSATLYYEATPVYNPNELIPRGVIVKMLSSDGQIDETVQVFNAAYEYEIDYTTGLFTHKPLEDNQ